MNDRAVLALQPTKPFLWQCGRAKHIRFLCQNAIPTTTNSSPVPHSMRFRQTRSTQPSGCCPSKYGRNVANSSDNPDFLYRVLIKARFPAQRPVPLRLQSEICLVTRHQSPHHSEANSHARVAPDDQVQNWWPQRCLADFQKFARTSIYPAIQSPFLRAHWRFDHPATLQPSVQIPGNL